MLGGENISTTRIEMLLGQRIISMLHAQTLSLSLSLSIYIYIYKGKWKYFILIKNNYKKEKRKNNNLGRLTNSYRKYKPNLQFKIKKHQYKSKVFKLNMNTGLK